MKIYSYQIDSRPVQVGGGWLLRLFENGDAIEYRVFPSIVGVGDGLGPQIAYDDAVNEASVWIKEKEKNNRRHREISR
jgi:hypothetical protein